MIGTAVRVCSVVAYLSFALVFAGGTSFADDIQRPAPPNIVILLADDLGYGELGCQGNRQIPTPHIDSIAANGVRFTAGYVTASYCSASRAGLMTGQYQARFGYDDNPTGARNELPDAGLPVSQKTLGDRLTDAGYATALVGKWHLGGTARFHPLRRGFDEFFGFTHEGHYFVPPPYDGVTTMLRRRVLPNGAANRWTSADGKLILGSHMGHNEPDYDANNPIVRQSQPVDESDYLTDAFTREAVEFIDRNKDRPFFLYVAYNAVHSPLQGADRYMEKFVAIDDIQRRIFAAMLANLDDSVGEVLAKLKDEKLLSRTLVFFLSDNGGPTRELTSSNLPLRGGKGQLYEGGIRVPFLAQWPGQIPAGTTRNEPVISLDIHATSLAAAGIKPSTEKFDGLNLLPMLRGRNHEVSAPGNAQREMYWRMNQKRALRSGDWKVVRNSASKAGPWELYNLSHDLSESDNLAETMPDKLREMIDRWQAWDAQMMPPVRWK